VIRLLRLLWHLLAVAGLAAVAALVWMALQGISAKPEPPAVEAAVARRARQLLIPASARARTNPEPDSPEGRADALAHWADHCASCHGADGRGQTEMGRGLYPRSPDMTAAATQSLSDGSLFYIIEHGVKLTGMPAWGNLTPEGELSSWRLVRFIRRLPSLSEAELADIETMMPVGPAVWRQREEERRFLEGSEPPPPPPPAHKHPPAKPGA
jgi:mono/diheme cytochrome c family protein